MEEHTENNSNILTVEENCNCTAEKSACSVTNNDNDKEMEVIDPKEQGASHSFAPADDPDDFGSIAKQRATFKEAYTRYISTNPVDTDIPCSVKTELEALHLLVDEGQTPVVLETFFTNDRKKLYQEIQKLYSEQQEVSEESCDAQTDSCNIDAKPIDYEQIKGACSKELWDAIHACEVTSGVEIWAKLKLAAIGRELYQSGNPVMLHYVATNDKGFRYFTDEFFKLSEEHLRKMVIENNEKLKESSNTIFRSYQPGAELMPLMDPYDWPDSWKIPREWLIDDIYKERTLNCIVGPSKSGKSWLAYDQAFCIHNGFDWMGRKVKQQNVLYIDGEMDSPEVYARVAALSKGYAKDGKEKDVKRPYFVSIGQSEIDSLKVEGLVSQYLPQMKEVLLLHMLWKHGHYHSGHEGAESELW